MTHRNTKCIITSLCLFLLLFLIIGAQAETTDTTTEKTILEDQQAIDDQLLAELESGYSFDDPLVVVNPYGWTPLCAVVIFSTEEATSVSMVVKGKDSSADLEYEFSAETDHVLPVIGLYAGETTTVELTLEDGSVTTLQITADNVDSAFLEAEVTVCEDETLLDNQLLFCSSFNTISDYILGVTGYDCNGDLRYLAEGLWGTPFFQLENGHFISASSDLYTELSSTTVHGFIEFDLVGKIYNQYDISSGFHHDLTVLPNGNYLIASAHEDGSTINDVVLEIDAETGEVVWTLDLLDILDCTDGINAAASDTNWFHCNSVDYDEENDAVILSGRMVDAVISVDRETKTLNWILGTSDGWTNTDLSLFFTPTDDDFEWQYLQHHATLLSNGNIMLFDNGGSRTKGTLDEEEEGVSGSDVYSRVVIYDIDTESMTISQVWEYGRERGDSWYSVYVSGVFEAEADNAYWITSGGILHSEELDTYDISLFSASTDESITDLETMALVDYVADGELVFELKLSTNVFRSFPYSPGATITASLDLTQPGYLFSSVSE